MSALQVNRHADRGVLSPLAEVEAVTGWPRNCIVPGSFSWIAETGPRGSNLPIMSTKSREVIWGGRIMGAQIRAQGAREAAKKAAREADRAGLRMEVLAGERVTGAEIARARVGRRSRKCTKATAESRAPI